VNNSGLSAAGDLVAMGRLIEQLKPSMTMIKSMLRIGAVSLLAVAIAATPAQLLAQSTNKPAADKKAPVAKKDTAAKKKAAHPFHGKLAAVDKVAKTIKVGESLYQITSETKIIKAGKPATLEDGVVGELVTGYVKPTDDGKMVATKVTFGAKADDKTGDKKKDK
jgi:hypothetical protein